MKSQISKVKGQGKGFVLLAVAYTLASIGLSLYSYTQVDLNLTLSRISIWQTIQKSFQHIGYFERPWSTALYLGLLAVFYFLYLVMVRAVKRGLVTRRELWLVIVIVTTVLVWSYPAFSYDLFNHMFTAKTVLVYHKNPYEVIPLQFTGVDPWLTFMRWTHVPSIYSPLWILFTLPAYLLGFGYFLVIMWNTKLLVVGSYLLAVWGIEKILTKVDPRLSAYGMAIFALNPLVLVESLVSAHNDMVMVALAIIGMFFFVNQNKFASFFMLSLSIAVKLVTVFLLPLYLFRWNRWYALATMTMGLSLFLVIFRREIQPWYLLWLMPLVALLPEWSDLTLLAAAVSLGLLLRYAPFLYLGHWNDPAPTIKTWVTLVPILVSLLIIVLRRVLPQFALKSS